MYVTSYEIDMGELRSYENSPIIRNLSKTVYRNYVSNYTETINDIAENIVSISSDMSDYDRINMVSKFVHYTVEYTSDSVGTMISDYFQFPLETLYLRTGDCEDMAILTVAILKAMGYDAETIVCQNHTIAGVNIDYYGSYACTIDGKRYLAIDPTSGGILGEYNGSMAVVVDDNLWFAELIFLVLFTAFTICIERGAWAWFRE